MIVTKHGIKVVAYVHTADGLKDVDEELTPEQRKKLADHIKCTWLNHLYRGKAVFFPEEGTEEPRPADIGRETSSVTFGDTFPRGEGLDGRTI